MTSEREELRELLAEPPGEFAFRAICALLDTWTGSDVEAAIWESEVAMESWPDSDRVATCNWLHALVDGASKPTWRLVRAIRTDSGHLQTKDVPLPSPREFPEMRGITEVCLPPHRDDLARMLESLDDWRSLKTLKIASDRDAKFGPEHVAHSVFGKLEELHVGDVREDYFHSPPPRFPVDSRTKHMEARRLTLRADDLLQLWKGASTPQLESLGVIILKRADALALAKRPELAQIKELRLSFRCDFDGSSPWGPFTGNVIAADNDAASAFFREAKLSNVKTLFVHGRSTGYWGREGIGPAGMQAIVDSGILPQLSHVHLQLLPLAATGLGSFIRRLNGERLEELRLVNVAADDEVADLIAGRGALPRLRTLDLSGNRIGPEGASRLAGMSLPALTHLDLSGPDVSPYYSQVGCQPIEDAGAAAWAKRSGIAHLRTLRLAGTLLTGNGLRELLRSPSLKNLEHLDVSHNVLGVDGARALSESTAWQSLRTLKLNQCYLDDDAIQSLIQVPRAPALRELSLQYNNIGPVGMTALARWPALQRMWTLDLHDNFIGSEGVRAIAESEHFVRLLELDLEQDCWNSRTRWIDDSAAGSLAAAKSLRRLDAVFCGMVDEYHGARYTVGFSRSGYQALLDSPFFRPEVLASLRMRECSEGDGFEIREWADSEERQKYQIEHDFRNYAATHMDSMRKILSDWSDSGARKLQQVRFPSAAKEGADT